MGRIRLSTIVDAALLSRARLARARLTAAALLARHQPDIDASYTAYDEHPADEADAWGDLASWRRAAGTNRGLGR